MYITVTGNTSLDAEIGIVRESLAELIQFATRVRSRLCLCLSGLGSCVCEFSCTYPSSPGEMVLV